jgi:Flp pilus assembly protein TadG
MSTLYSRLLTSLTARLPDVPLLRRFRRDRRGVTAVEFGMVAAPFLALLFAIIETAMVFFASQALETAVADSSRLILTGQAQTQQLSQQQFKNALCSRISALFDCQGGVQIDVKCYSGFGGADLSKPLDANGNLKTDFSFCPGEPGQIVVVRAMYQWPVWLSLLGFNLSDMSNGKRLLMATSTFRNEPFK